MEIESWIEKNKVSPAIAESQGLLFVVDPAIINALIEDERDRFWDFGYQEAESDAGNEVEALEQRVLKLKNAIQKHKEEKGQNEGFSDSFDEELYKSIK